MPCARMSYPGPRFVAIPTIAPSTQPRHPNNCPNLPTHSKLLVQIAAGFGPGQNQPMRGGRTSKDDGTRSKHIVASSRPRRRGSLAHALGASAAHPPRRSLARMDRYVLRPGPALLRRLPHRRSARRTDRPRRLHELPPSRTLPFGRARFAAARAFSDGSRRRRNSRTAPCRRIRRQPRFRFGSEADVVACAARKPFRPRSPTWNLIKYSDHAALRGRATHPARAPRF
jgi:hypothetical protein